MKSYILSIDQGTTSCRAIVFGKSGKTKGLGQKEFKQFFPQPGWVEHDAEEILSTQIECIKDAIKDAGIKPEEIACVGITNQRETTVVWNKKTGKPVHHAIVWQCRRTQKLVEELSSQANEFREKTGLVPDAYFSGPKIRWILDNVKGARELAKKGELAFGTIDTWLIWNLTSEKNHYTEPSNASRTMLYNIKSMSWDDQLLSHLQVPKSMMPQVIPSNGQFGETNEKLLGFKAPIRANLGDQQAALFGQCCFELGMGKCTYGTGSFLLTNIGTEAKLVPGLLTTVAWQLEGKPPAYAFEGAIFVAGAAIQWLRDGLGIIESSAETQKLAESLSSNEGVFFVPAFVGLGSPYWNSDVRGTITGLTRGTTKAHLARAALESMAFQIADVAKGMSENGIGLKELRVDGGVTRNDFMVQFQADLLKVPVIRSAQTESTAWGVGALAALSCGLVKDLAELSADWQLDSKIMPKEDRNSDYKGWQAALKGAFAVAEAQFQSGS